MRTPITLLCGAAGSGKDTVAGMLRDHLNAAVIAQADPMKQFAARVFGFTEHQLWGPSEARNAEDARFLEVEAWEKALENLLNEKTRFFQEMEIEEGWTSQLCGWFNLLRGAYFPIPQDGWPPLGSVGCMLSNERGRFLVDFDDHERVRQYSWHIKDEARKNASYAKATVDGKEISLHRFVLGVSDPNIHVDHINGDGLDNRRVNLRVCNNQENHFNTNAKGYTWDESRQKWSAKIMVDGKTVNLGRFSTEAEARDAYLNARKLYFGEFAKKGLTPRLVLQTLGTEFGRVINPSMWSDLAIRNARKLLVGGHVYDRLIGLSKAKEGFGPDLVVITDGRFRNEILNVRAAGGAAVKIVNPAESGLAAGAAGHRSEAELGQVPDHFFDFVLVNDKSRGLDCLKVAVTGLAYFLRSAPVTIGTAPPADET